MNSVSPITNPRVAVAAVLIAATAIIAGLTISQVSSAKTTKRHAKAAVSFGFVTHQARSADTATDSIAKAFQTLQGDYGVPAANARRANPTSADIPVWVATGGDTTCVLAQFPTASHAIGYHCGPVSDAQNGKASIQAVDPKTGAATQVGFVPDATTVTVNGAAQPISGNAYVAHAKEGDTITVHTPVGSSQSVIPRQP
jgi:hypothetical protein